MWKALFLLIVLFGSCKQEKRDIVKEIAGEEFKFWTVTDSQSTRRTLRLHYFDRKGNWIVYIRLRTGEIETIDNDDVFVEEKWHYVDDSSVYIGGRIYKIDKLNPKEFNYSFEGEPKVNLTATPDSLLIQFKNK